MLREPADGYVDGELAMRAPKGKTLRGLAPTAGAVGFAVVHPVRYVGRRAVTVRAFTLPRVKAGSHTGRIWALVA